MHCSCLTPRILLKGMVARSTDGGAGDSTSVFSVKLRYYYLKESQL